jgi:hypothetical protein
LLRPVGRQRGLAVTGRGRDEGQFTAGQQAALQAFAAGGRGDTLLGRVLGAGGIFSAKNFTGPSRLYGVSIAKSPYFQKEQSVPHRLPQNPAQVTGQLDSYDPGQSARINPSELGAPLACSLAY